MVWHSYSYIYPCMLFACDCLNPKPDIVHTSDSAHLIVHKIFWSAMHIQLKFKCYLFVIYKAKQSLKYISGPPAWSFL